MRTPWRRDNYPVFVAGTYRREWRMAATGDHNIGHFRPGLADHRSYNAAKKEGDIGAALRVVHDTMDRLYITKMKLHLNELAIQGVEKPIIVAPFKPHSQNRLARAAAIYLGEQLGLEVDTNIVETDTAPRKELTKLGRIFTPARFEGQSKEGRWYIAVDDNMLSGSTFADLRSHLVSNGSRFAFACALSTPDGKDTTLNVSQAQLSALSKQLTGTVRDWMKNVAGVGIESLTRVEAGILCTEQGRHDLRSFI